MSKQASNVTVVLLQTADLVECPVNPGHLLMHQSLGKHLKYCPLTSKGYSKNEIVSLFVTFLTISVFTFSQILRLSKTI